LAKLEIAVTPGVQERLSQWWPGALSVVLPCPAESLHYLHCGTKTLAVRWPADERLQTILAATGPLVSTTVNLEGEAPAQSVAEAEKIFGSQVDAYLDGGELRGSSSTLIRVKGEQIEVLRQGDVKVDL
jgi:tRNA A37 threonylcarbamoyladenosine synthetase subunit TsaC/SUA5/YrdC